MIVAAKGVAAETAGSDVPAGEAATQPGKPGVDFKMPLAAQPEAPLVEPLKTGPAKMTAEAATVRSAFAEIAGPAEAASGDGSPAPAAGTGPPITTPFPTPLTPLHTPLHPAQH